MKKKYTKREPKEFNLFRAIFQRITVRWVYGTYYRVTSNFKIMGKKNIPKEKFFIVASNHVSAIDPFIVADAVNCPIAYMAKIELFEKPIMRIFMDLLGAFAVNREKPELATFKTVKDIMSTNWSLGVFPQGGTRPYGKLNDLKKGFVVIAKKAQADIVPVAIGNWDGYPDKTKPKEKKNVTLHICKPISYKLDADEILYLWSKEISEHADYTEIMPKPEKITEKEPLNC